VLAGGEVGYRFRHLRGISHALKSPEPPSLPPPENTKARARSSAPGPLKSG
jgi:hypothetical protein